MERATPVVADRPAKIAKPAEGRESNVEHSGSTYDNRIRSLQRRLEQLRDEMEQASLDFLDATERFLSDWYEEQARMDVASQPVKARRLGRSGLKRVKRQVRALQKRVSRLVEEQLDRDLFWTHRRSVEDLCNGLSARRYNTYSDEGAAELKEPVITLASQLGPVLAESGLLRFGSTWVRRGTAIRLGVSPSWSGEMRTAMERYRDLNTELMQRARELFEARKQQAEAEVLDMWDAV